MKLAILGFDGFDSRIFEQTSLPNIKRIRENGQWGTLHSAEMRTGPCWTTILTGLEIETHGITHLLGYPKDGSQWFLSRPRDYIFDVLHDNGFSVGVANFPGLVYSREMGTKDHARSWMIAGWPRCPVIRSSFTYEPDIMLPWDLFSDLPDYESRVLDRDKRKPKNANDDWAIHEIPWEEYIEWAAVNAFKRLDTIRTLPGVNVLMVQESVLDRAGHMLSTPNKGRQGTDDPRYQEALQLVDRLIGNVLQAWKPDYLSVVSDHGFQGISEAEPEKGCWHSTRGVWAVMGPNIVPLRNNIEQVHYASTVLGSIDVPFGGDGEPHLIKEDFSDVKHSLRALGYI